MKVLFVPDFTPWNSYQRVLADALSRSGVEVIIDMDMGLGRRRWPILSAVRLSGKVSIIHLHWLHSVLIGGGAWRTIVRSWLFLGDLLLIKMSGIKIVWTVHNIVNHEGQHQTIDLFFRRLLFRVCDHVIVHCEAAKLEVMKTYKASPKRKLSAIPHGHYIGNYENQVSRSKARRLLQIPPGETVFLHFGTLRPYKGASQLVKAFKALGRQDTRLLIVGSPINEEAAREVEETVRGDKRISATLKYIPDDEIQLYMNAADVVVMTFQRILTSGSVLLAMSFGKPVIAPRLGCIPEVLDDNGAILYDPKDKSGLAKAMGMAVESDFEAMGMYNLEEARKLDWDEIAEKTSKLYKSLFHTVTTH